VAEGDLTSVYPLEGDLDPAGCRQLDAAGSGYTVDQGKTAIGAGRPQPDPGGVGSPP
jgi:hypothetical protein